MFQDEVVPLREEAVEEQLDLPTARQFLSAAVFQQGADLKALMAYIQQLLYQMKGRRTQEFYEANMLLVFAKILDEYGALPQLNTGTLLKDVFLKQEAAERLEDLQEQDLVNFYSLLLDSQNHSKKRLKRNSSATSSQTSWAVRWIALLAKMACAAFSQQDTVEWTAVESRTKTWLNGVFYHVEIKAGLALAALDILDSATSEQPIIANVTITGLTPRRVFDMLQVPNVVDFALVQAAAPIDKFQLLSQFADVLLTFSMQHQKDEELRDTARVCDVLVRQAFQNTPSFLLDELAKKKNGQAPPVTLSSKKRKRLAETADPSSRMATILDPSYPFLVRIQVKLANDNRTDAQNVAYAMERCSALKEGEKIAAWSYILDHFRSNGDLFLDGNHVKGDEYLTKRTALFTLRRFMGELGLDTLIDWYKQLADEVGDDPLTTLAEKEYVKLASQHTVLKLLLDKFGDAEGVKRMLDEYPGLYIWKEGGDTQKWALNFLKTSNPIPESLLLENGQIDMQSLWKRAPPEQPVAAIELEQVEVVVEPEVVVEEQAIVEPPPQQQQQEEARPVQPVIEEIVLSSDDEEEQIEEDNFSSEDQNVEEILESDEDLEDAQAYNSYDEEGGSGDEFDDYMLEQQQDRVIPEQREQARGEQVVDLLNSTTEEESSSSEQGSEESDGTREFEQPAARPAREYQEETSDEEEEEVDATFGSIPREAEDAINPEPVREAVDDYDEELAAAADSFEEDAYDSQEGDVPDGNNVVEVESSPEEECDGSEGEEFAEGSAVEAQFTTDVEAKEGTEYVVERGHIDKGYEPDTTGQTEEEDDDDRKLSASPPKSYPHARSLIDSRPTLSDMDAADERTEPSDVEDQGKQERRSLASQVASSLNAHVQDTRRNSPSSYQPDQGGDDWLFHRPAARPQFQAERYEEAELLIVDEVPKIDDVIVGDDATNETVGPSVAFSDSRAGEIPRAERLDEAIENVVDHVPPVDDARDGDDSSAAFAASETGKYLSESNTEQPEEITETRVGEEESPSKPAAKDVPEKKSTRKGTGNETDGGYMGDIEERPSATANAAATTAAFSMQGPGYEADVEERSVARVGESLPKKPSPTARSLPTGLVMGDSPAEDDSVVVHPTDDSVSGFSVTGMRHIRSTSSEVPDTEDALKTDDQDEQPEDNDDETAILTEAQESIVSVGRKTEASKPGGEEASSLKPEEEQRESQSPTPNKSTPVKGALEDSDDIDAKQEEHAGKQQTPFTPPRATSRPISDLYGSPASHTRSHDPPVEEQSPRSINRPSDWFGSPASHTRSHDPPDESDEQSVSESTEAADDDSKEKSRSTSGKDALAEQSKMDQQTKEEAESKQDSPPTSPRSVGRTSDPSPTASRSGSASSPMRKNPPPEPSRSVASSESSLEKRSPGRPRKSPPPEPSPGATGPGSVSSPAKRGPGRPRKSAPPEPSPAASRSESASSPTKRGPGRPRKSRSSEPSPARSRSGSASSPTKRGPGRPRKSRSPEPSPAASRSESSPKKRGPGRPRKTATPGSSGLTSPDLAAAAARTETTAVENQVEAPTTPTRSTRNSVGVVHSATSHLRSHGTPATKDMMTTSQKKRRAKRDKDASAEKETASQPKAAEADAETPSTRDKSLGSVSKKRPGSRPKRAKTEEDDTSISTRRSTRLREKQSSPAAELSTKKRRGRPKKEDDDEGTAESPPKKRRGRPKKADDDEEAAESPPKKRRDLPKKADDDEGTAESPPKKRRGRPKKADDEEESAESPPKKRRGRPKKADDDEGTAESPPKKRRGRPKKADDEEESAESPPKKTRGRPPKVKKEEAKEDEESVATTRRSSRIRTKKVEATQPARRTRSRRSNSNAEEDDSQDENESDDEVDSQASTRKSRQPARKGKKKANPGRESLGSIPEQVAEDDEGGSVSSMGSSSVASKRKRRTTRATASRDSLSAIAESPTSEKSSTTRTRSRTSAAKKAPPATKRKTRSSARGSASSVASTSSRTTRSSSYNLRGKK